MKTGSEIVNRIAGEESGFTLIELLVTMIIAIVTALALFAFQDLALHQSSRVFAKVDATQQARNTIEVIESRLHSACVAEDVTPIQAGSTTQSLFFISKYGGAATVTPEFHKIYMSGTSLIDATYAATGTSAANWAPAASPSSSRTLLTNVTPASGTSSTLFTYYAYGVATDSAGHNYIDAAGDPYVMLLDGTSTLPPGITTYTGGAVPAGTVPANSPLTLDASPTNSNTPPGLSQANAQITSAVGIKLVVDANGALGTFPQISDSATTVSDVVTLRITPVPSDNNQGVPGPCE
jgi:Tfp pilus assembly protein PilV